jgi:hypothetical protein
MSNAEKAREIVSKYLLDNMDKDLKKKIAADLKAAGCKVKAVRFSFIKRYISVTILDEGKKCKIIVAAPKTSETPKIPETLKTPEIPKTLEVPKTPEIPKTPETPKTPEIPQTP